MPISTSQYSSELARQALVEVLSENGPQLGAKLKVRLTEWLGRRLSYPSDQWYTLLPKLSAFLAAHADLVDVQRPSSSGDIRISLRKSRQQADAENKSPVRYRSNVWMAFINPDPQRRRFFHRRSGEVVHYTLPASGAASVGFADRVAKDAQFIEIEFASAETQREWFRKFLDANTFISEAQEKVARHFLNIPFDSSVNTAFAAALGPHAEAWKRYRAQAIDDHIANWANLNGVELAALSSAPVVDAKSLGVKAEKNAAGLSEAQAVTVRTKGNLRLTLRELTELLDESELACVLVPLSAVERISRSRS